jgi:hypothetical protein
MPPGVSSCPLSCATTVPETGRRWSSCTSLTLVSSVARPVTQLIGFARIQLAASAAARVAFTVHTDRLSFTGPNLERIVEPGEVQFRVGTAGVTFPGQYRYTWQGRTALSRGNA